MWVLAVSEVMFGAAVIVVGIVGFVAGLVLASRSGRDWSQVGSTGPLGISHGREDSPRRPTSQKPPEDEPPG